MEILITAVAGLGASALLTVLVWTLVARNNGLSDRLILAADNGATSRIAAKDLQMAVDERDRALAQVTQRCESEASARKSAEAHRDALLARLAETGDSSAIVAAIRDELHNLSALSGAAPASAAEGGGGPVDLHASAAKP